MIGTPLKLINWLYQQDKDQVFFAKNSEIVKVVSEM